MWIIGLVFKDGKFVRFRIQQSEPLVCAHPNILQMVFIDCINAIPRQTVGILRNIGEVTECFIFQINDAQSTLCMAYVQMSLSVIESAPARLFQFSFALI